MDKFAYRCIDCGEFAFFLKNKPIGGYRFREGELYYSNGTSIKPGDLIKCEKCQSPQQRMFLSNIVDLVLTGWKKGEYESNTGGKDPILEKENPRQDKVDDRTDHS